MQLATGDRVGPYEVLSRLGSGGMGDVYLARDPRLDRRVALKLLRARPSGAGPDRTRLLREGRAAARIVHPRVAAVFDVVDTGEHPVLVLEYVEGRTLRRVMDGGPLPVPRALDIGTQICEALEAAHAHGVVHGDIKPENICLTEDGRVKVLDFGIARVVPRGDRDVHLTLTSDSVLPDAFAGTPRYAAPELFSGSPPDAQTDVYAAAAVLFEMLTGAPPHAGESALDIGLKALSESVARVDALRPQVPRPLADVVARGLSRERRARTMTAAALASELRAATALGDGTGDVPTLTSAEAGLARSGGPEASAAADTRAPRLAAATRRRPRASQMLAAASVAVALIAWATWPWAAPTAAPDGSMPRVLAVLPLEVIGDHPRSASLGLGIADTLIADLADTPGLVLVSRRTSMPLAEGGRNDLARIARDVGATILVDGTVQTLGDTLRISLTLVTPDGAVTWGQSAEGRLTQVFDLQRQLAIGLRRALQLQEPGARGGHAAARDARPQGPATLDLDALADYTDAIGRLSRQDLAGNVALAIEGFSRALARDPGFVLAHVGLSDAYMADYRQTRREESLARATHHADEAASLAPYHAETWVAVARIRKVTGRHAEAQAALERALSLQPAHDDAWRELGIVRAEQANRAGADEAFRRALALRPGFWQNHHEYGRFLFETSQYEASAAEFRRVIEFQPDSPRGYQALGTVYQAQGRLADAIANYERATALSPSVNAHLNTGVLQHWEGRYRDAITSYERAVALAPDDPVPPRNVGDSLLKLGDEAGARMAYVRALDLAERELRRNAGAADMRELRAVLLAKLGRHAEASHEAAALVAATPDQATAHHTLSVVLALGGRGGEARAALERALALGYPRTLAERDDDLADVLGPRSGGTPATTTTGGRDR